MTAVVILGMHRSGTSALTGCLSAEGLHLGEVIQHARFNPKGNQEPRAIMHMQEALLEANGGSWRNPPDQVAWGPEHRAVRDRFIANFRGHALWGFKDPRTLFTLGGWLERLESPRFVGVFRHPLRVAQSLRARSMQQDGVPLLEVPEGLRLWSRYNERLLRLFQAEPFPILSFDLPGREFVDQVSRVGRWLGLPQAKTQPFFDASLRSSPDQGALPREVEDLLTALRTASETSLSGLTGAGGGRR